MEEEKKKQLWIEGKSRMEAIGHSVRDVIAPQIQQFSESYHDYLKDVSTSAGILLGGVVALWSTKFIVFVPWLTIASFLFLAASVVLSFYFRKKAVIVSVPYVLYLRKLSRKLTEHSNKIVLFSRKELSVEDYEKEKNEFESQYQTMRSGLHFEELENNETSSLERTPKWYSEINIVTLLFLSGIALIVFSVLFPQFCNILTSNL
ncbi:MAG: hypothetical protein V1696_01955 [Candidatus Jorgensenbacteria bacterium]